MNATFPVRFKAFLIDYILILIYLLSLFIISIFLFPSVQELFSGSLIVAQLIGFLLVTLPISLYFIICDSVLNGQSFGKKKTGLQVLTNNGNKLSIGRAAFRTSLKFLPWEMSHFLAYRFVSLGNEAVPFHYYLVSFLLYSLIFAYILTAIFTKKKQTLYDLIAKTQVIKVASFIKKSPSKQT